MKRNQDTPHHDGSEFSKQIPTQEADGAIERQCLHCGSWAVHPLGLIYASSTPTLAALSPYGVATPSLPLWVAARAYPPEKMATWTGYTLSLLFWPPCLFLLATYLYGWLTTGGFGIENASLYMSGGLVGLVAWSIPAFLRRKEADEHNRRIWEPAMNKWHTSHMCLKCGRV
jgi:hypothetical protein